MDDLDRVILSLLQGDGRMSATQVSDEIGLSVSACHRRIKELEKSGAISGYRAVVSPQAIGLSFEAIVFVTIDRTDHGSMSEFEEAVMNVPQVVEAERLFGEPDYMLRVLTHDVDTYQRLYDSTLGTLPGVHRLTSTLVMKNLRGDRAVPL